MELNKNDIKIANLDSGHWLCLKLDNDQLEPLNKILNNNKKETVVDVSNKKEKRSITANSYSWVLLGLLAAKLTIPKGDLYVKMLKQYGCFTSIMIKSEAIEEFIRTWNATNTNVEHTESLCEVTNSYVKNGTRWVELSCHFGSSTYNSIDFSKYLKGIISDCEIAGVDTMTPQEIERLIKMMEE